MDAIRPSRPAPVPTLDDIANKPEIVQGLPAAACNVLAMRVGAGETVVDVADHYRDPAARKVEICMTTTATTSTRRDGTDEATL